MPGSLNLAFKLPAVIPDCLSGAGGEASFRNDAERAIEISQTLTVAEGITHHPHPIGIDLQSSRSRLVFLVVHKELPDNRRAPLGGFGDSSWRSVAQTAEKLRLSQPCGVAVILKILTYNRGMLRFSKSLRLAWQPYSRF